MSSHALGSTLSKIFESSQNLHGIDLAPKFQFSRRSRMRNVQKRTIRKGLANGHRPQQMAERNPGDIRSDSEILQSPLVGARYPDSRGRLLRLRHPARDRSNGDHLHGITVWLRLHWDRLGRDEFGGGQRLHAELYGNRCADLRRLKTDPRIV